MRIAVAAVVIADLFIRLSDLRAHYSDEGMWPLHMAQGPGWKNGYWSLHLLNGSTSWQLFLFITQLVFAVFLLLGYYTRMSNLIVWLLYISLHNRNVFVLQAGDDLLRLVLLWGLFLPWHAAYSFDARKKERKIQSSIVGNLGYLALIASVYFFSVNLKTSEEWRSDGTAVYYALSLEQLRLPLGDLIYTYPSLLKFFTWMVMAMELAIPLLILWPDKKGSLRFIGFILILILHTGIGLTLYVGLFYIISISSAIGLIPAFILNKMAKKFRLFSAQPRGRLRHSSLQSGVAIILFALCLTINLGSLNWFGYGLRVEVETGTNALRLDQYWGMFSPGVLKKDGWFVYHGADTLGRAWDLRRNQDSVDFSKPKRVVSMYKNDRWRKLAENMQNDKYNFLRPMYCQYFLHEWNKEHPQQQMKLLNLYYMTKETLPAYAQTQLKKELYCVCHEP